MATQRLRRAAPRVPASALTEAGPTGELGLDEVAADGDQRREQDQRPLDDEPDAHTKNKGGPARGSPREFRG